MEYTVLDPEMRGCITDLVDVLDTATLAIPDPSTKLFHDDLQILEDLRVAVTLLDLKVTSLLAANDPTS